jgi:hypothetical protein
MPGVQAVGGFDGVGLLHGLMATYIMSANVGKHIFSDPFRRRSGSRASDATTAIPWDCGKEKKTCGMPQVLDRAVVRTIQCLFS